MVTMPPGSNSNTCKAASSDSNQQFCVRWNSHLGSIGAAFPQLLAGQRFVDVTLACEGHQVHCHRLVLAACSHYFENLLNDNPCKHPIIILPRDIRLWEIQALIDFMYKGEVNVSQAGLNDLLNCAEILQIRGLCGSNPANGTSSNITNICDDNEELTETINANTYNNNFVTNTNSNSTLTTTTTTTARVPMLLNNNNNSSSAITSTGTGSKVNSLKHHDIGSLKETSSGGFVQRQQNLMQQFSSPSSSQNIIHTAQSSQHLQHSNPNIPTNMRMISPSPLDTIAEVASYARTQCLGMDDTEEDDIGHVPSYEIKCEEELIIDMNEDSENMKSAELDEEEEEDMDGSNSEKLQSEINHHFVQQQLDTQPLSLLMPSQYSQPVDLENDNSQCIDDEQQNQQNVKLPPLLKSSTPQPPSTLQQSIEYLNQNNIIRVKSVQNISDSFNSRTSVQRKSSTQTNSESFSNNNYNDSNVNKKRSGCIRVVSPQHLISFSSQPNKDIVLPPFLKFDKKSMDIYVKSDESTTKRKETPKNIKNMNESDNAIDHYMANELNISTANMQEATDLITEGGNCPEEVTGEEVVDIICSPNFMDLSYEDTFDDDIEVIYDSSMNSDYNDEICRQRLQQAAQNMEIDMSNIINPPPLIPFTNNGVNGDNLEVLNNSTPLSPSIERKISNRNMKAESTTNNHRIESINLDDSDNNMLKIIGCDTYSGRMENAIRKSTSTRTSFSGLPPLIGNVSNSNGSRHSPCPIPTAFVLRNPRGNQPRTYTTDALWAALMDVKSGESIYRASQMHKVPRKTLRNWMKRWDIKSAYPMPVQLKQAAENKRRAKDKLLLKQVAKVEAKASNLSQGSSKATCSTRTKYANLNK